MNTDLRAVFGQIVSLYTRAPLAQKIAIPLLLACSVGIIVFVSRWAGRPDYSVLFSGLAESDAASIVERLKDQKIGFRLRDDGSTIEVTPASLVHELRLEMSASGLPKGSSVGFELFSEGSLGRTGFVERLNFIRGLQGELERTIKSIDAVRSVRVHITNPERSAFVKRDVLPTASVLIRFKAGEQLDTKQVKGIANLVANSVERLNAENVAILDSFGNVLNEKRNSEELGGADDTKLDYRHKVELNLQRRIETMLSEILGPGRVVARVRADMDFSRYQKEEELFDPAGQVIRSTRQMAENSGLTAEGGIPGVVSNLTNDPGLLTPPDSSENANIRNEAVTNFEISKSISKTTTAPGKINKLSVAVLVDGFHGDTTDTEVTDVQYQPLVPEMIKKIENLVKQSVGYDPTRGDVVTVENMRFFDRGESFTEALEAAESDGMIDKYISWAAPILFIMLFMLMLVRPLIKFLISPTEAEVDLSRLLPTGVEELEAELEVERRKLAIAVPESEHEEPLINIEQLEGLLAENSTMVRDNPQQAALLIRYWLNDGPQ